MSLTLYQHQTNSARVSKHFERNRPDQGFSLVELLVASTILIIAFVALLTLIRAGRAIDIETLHRRAARSIIDSVFESPSFNYTNYDNFESFIDTTSVPLDKISPPFMGLLTVWVTDAPNIEVIVNGILTHVWHKQVTVSIAWVEAGKTDSSKVEITKKISTF